MKKMEEKKFYLLLLLLPLVGAGFAWIILSIDSHFKFLPSVLQGPVVFGFLSIFELPQYTVMVLCLLDWLKEKSLRYIQRVFLILPILFAPISLLPWFMLKLTTAQWAMGLSLKVGYFYVCLAFLLGWLARRFNLLRTESS